MSEILKVGRFGQSDVPINRPALHPVQRPRHQDEMPLLCDGVVMRAYEVYAYVHSPQDAMITGGCRGGFAASELIAFLYARGFPREEWPQRVDEALAGMNGL